MMLINPFSGLFKGKNKVPDAPEPKPESKADTKKFQDVPVHELLEALEGTSQALTRYGLSESSIEEHVKTLSAMKSEISGLREARAIPALSEALKEVFEKSLRKAFLYGNAAQIEKVKEIIFTAIQALAQVGSQEEQIKNQTLATLDLDISAISGEIWEGNHLIAKREEEGRERARALGATDPFNLPESVKLIAAQVQQLRDRNAAAQTELDRLQQQRHNIEADAEGASFKETEKRISEFLGTLPSTAKIIQSIEEIAEIKETNEAKMANDLRMMETVVSGVSEEARRFLPNQEASTQAAGTPEAQAPGQLHAQPYSH